jgi:hypothetical protein
VLFGAEALPGEGWEITEEDVFTEDGGSTLDPTVPSCPNIIAAYEEVDAISDPERVGRAQRKLVRDEGDITREVEVEEGLVIFASEVPPRETLARFDDIFLSAEFAECFEGTIGNGLPEGSFASAVHVEPLAQAPNDGVAVSMEVTIGTGGRIIVLRFETYLWQVGNGGASISVTGPEDLDASVSEAAIVALQQGIERVAGAEPTATASPGLAFEPSDARALALQALPAVDDFAGEGWRQVDEDSFEAGPLDDISRQSDACNAILEVYDPLREQLTASVADQAEVEYSNAPEGGSIADGALVTVHVAIFTDTFAIEETMDAVREIFGSDDYTTCISDTLAPVGASNVTAVEPLASAPNDGAAVALEMTLTDEGETADIRLEFYQWTFENAMVITGVGGVAANLDPAVHETVIDGVQARLEEIAARE